MVGFARENLSSISAISRCRLGKGLAEFSRLVTGIHNRIIGRLGVMAAQLLIDRGREVVFAIRGTTGTLVAA